MLLLLALVGPVLTAFSESTHTFSISEEASVGTLIGRVPLQNGVDFRVSGGPQSVSVDLRTGEISLQSPIDREKNPFINFSLVSSQPPSIIHIHIDVEDVNDNAPAFPLAFQNVSVLETAAVGTRLPILAATDPDEGEFGTISRYELIGDKVFRLVEEEQNVIFLDLQEPLDRERNHLYSYNLTATDGGGRTGWTSIYVQVLDVNDCAPQFEGKKIEAFWNGRSETPVLVLNATDEDEGENAKITYEIVEKLSDFEIKGEEVYSKVGSPACCSHPPCAECFFAVRAVDGGHPPLSTTVGVTVYLSGDNQHDPIIHIKLQPSHVDFAVIEETDEAGKAVAVLSVTDEDGPFGDSGYLRVTNDEDSFFHLDTKLNPALSILRLAKNASSFIKRELFLSFEASDGQKPPRTCQQQLKFYVGGAERTAKKAPVHLSARLREDAPPGSFLVQVGASTTGCSFSMRNTSGLPVDIDTVSGILTTSGVLPGPGSFFLDVSVLPPPPSIEPYLVSIDLTVDDVNNHAPVIKIASTLEISEESTPGAEVVTFEVEDEDQGDNGKVKVSVIEGEDCFKVTKTKLILNCRLDYEKKNSFDVILEAADGGKLPLSSRKVVKIVVKDANDNVPYFPCAESHVSISHLTPFGTEIGRIEAGDRDSGEFGRVSYSILDPTAEFSIHSEDGMIFTAGKLEERKYELRLRATDGGGLVSSKNATLFIHVSSQSLPFFAPSPQYILLPDPLRLGDPLLHLKGNGSSFHSLSPLLNVDSNGVVSLASAPPSNNFHAAVLLKSQKISVSQCLHFEKKKKAEPPRFEKRRLDLKLDDSTPLGSTLARLLPCEDSFCSLSTDCPTLVVNEDGTVVLAKLMTVDNIKCSISAKDILNREDRMEVEITKKIQEQKDVRLRSHNEFFVSSDLPLGTVIGHLPTSEVYIYTSNDSTSVGIFPDGVIYVRRALKPSEVVSFRVKATHRRLGNEHRGEVWVRVGEPKEVDLICPKTNDFYIRENNEAGSTVGLVDIPWNAHLRQIDGFKNILVTPLGKILILHSLDAEVKTNVTFRAEVIVGKKKVPCSFTVAVEDQNEFAPVFAKAFYSVQLPPGTSSGVIGSVEATDPDRDRTNISYHLQSFHHYFKMNKTSGELSVHSKLPSGGFFNVSILARDNGSPPLNSSTFFIVRTGTSDENSITFKDNSTISISSSTAVGSIVGRCLSHSDVTVSIHSQDPRFSIDSFGWIRLLARPSSLPKEVSLKLNANGTVSNRLVVVSDAVKVKENRAPITVQPVEKGVRIAVVNPPTDAFQVIEENLVVTKALDKEINENYRIVMEKDGKYSLIHVEVEDSPDSLPICGSNTFLVGNLPAVVHLSCWDPDTGSSIHFMSRTLKNGMSLKYDGTLTIEKLEDVTTVVEVDVTDKRSEPVSISVILIRDKSDDSISFPSPSFNLLLSSSLKNNQSFGRVSAEAEARVNYFVIGSDAIGVQKETGELIVKNSSDIVWNPVNRDVILVAASRVGIASVQIRVEIVEDSLFIPRSSVLLTPQRVVPGGPVGKIDIGRKDVVLDNTDDRFSLEGRQLIFKKLPEQGNGKLVTLDLEARKGRISSKVKVFILLPDTKTELIFTVPENAPRETIIGAIPEGESFEIGGNVPLRLDSEGFVRTTEKLDREKISEYSFTLNSVPEDTVTRAKLMVTDENDNRPVLWQERITVEAKEDLEVESTVTRIRWNDSDSSNYFVFKIVEGNELGQFFIDRKGLLNLQAPLDWERTREHRLTVTLQDGVPPLAYHIVHFEVIITVIDINDHAPLMTSPSSFTVEENTIKGTTIGAVTATDRDSAAFFSYRIVPNSLPFAEFIIDPIYGYLQVNGVIDYEVARNYTFLVEINDGLLVTTEQIRVYVVDKNDVEPRFAKGNETFSVKETAPVGYAVTRLQIKDYDGDDNSFCEFWSEGGGNYFKVVPRSGMIYVARKLDYEVSKEVVLTVFARNLVGGEAAKTTITIKMEDINDEAPRFLRGSPQAIEVYENVPGPFPLILGNSVSEEEDVNDVVAYSLLSGNSSIFGVDSRTGDILLLRNLDREEHDRHQLTVLATDSGRPRMTATAEITVIVLDDNDNAPEFDQPYFVAKIRENTLFGTPVVSIKATDKDQGRNADITYSLSGKDIPFTIDSQTGSITVGGPIDREEREKWEFEVEATDNGRFQRRVTRTWVTVRVEDDNDNPPVIRNKQMDVFVDGKLAKGEVVHVVDAWDSDGDIPSLFLSGTDSRFFEVTRDGRIISRMDSLLSKSFYSVTVTADDERGKITTATFTFYVDDAFFPRFKSVEPVLIPENSLQVVAVFNATSSKPSPRNLIQYSILAGNDGSFEIGPLNGVLRTRKELDRERIDFYRIWVMATDNDIPAKSSIQSVEIRVADKNDNKPTFGQVVYTASIKENEGPSELVTVTASDEDIGRNAVILFSIAEGNEDSLFTIDSRGTTRTTGPLDREVASVHRLVIKATDGGSSPMTNIAVVLVEVGDEDDNSPRFTRLFHAEIQEDLQIGSEVVLVSASDSDAHGNHSFHLEDGDGTFSINELTGMIYLAKELDREKVSSYRLRVRLEDGVWTIFASVQITVLDANDNFPVFELDTCIFTINPENPNIGAVAAKDPDEGENGKIYYSLLNDNPFVTVDATTGKIMQIGTFSRNYVKITIVARDGGVPSQSSTAQVFILNNPTVQQPLVLYLTMTSEVGEIIGKLKTKSFISSTSLNLSIDGTIRLKNANTSEGPAGTLVSFEQDQTLMRPLELHLLPQPPSSPRFITKIFHYSIVESVAVGTEIGRISVGGRGWTTYTSTSSKPLLVTDSGALILSEQLDFHEKNRHFFNVTAEDVEGRRDAAQVILDVLDSKEHPLMFEVEPFWIRVLTTEKDKICLTSIEEGAKYSTPTAEVTVENQGCLDFEGQIPDELEISARSGRFEEKTKGRIVDLRREGRRSEHVAMVNVSLTSTVDSILYQLSEKNCTLADQQFPKGICFTKTAVTRCGRPKTSFFSVKVLCNELEFQVDIHTSREEEPLPQIIASVRESSSSQTITRLPSKDHRHFYIDDPDLKKLFSISEDGVLSSKEGLDRDQRAWYTIPVKTSDRQRFDVRVIVDDVVDSPLPENKDLSVVVIGTIGEEEEKAAVHPATEDTTNSFECRPASRGDVKVSRDCLLTLKKSPPEFSLSLTAVRNLTMLPYNVRISTRIIPPAIKTALPLRIFAPESGVAEFLTGLEEQVSDLQFFPLSLTMTSRYFYTIALTALDRFQRPVGNEDLQSVVDSFLKRHTLVQILPSERINCGKKNATTAIITTGRHLSIRGSRTAWMIPEGRVETRCLPSTAVVCSQGCSFVNGECNCSSSKGKTCTSATCPGGTCLEKGGDVTCVYEQRKNGCEDPQAVSLSKGYLELRPTSHLYSLPSASPECNDTWIGIDFRTNSDGALITFEYDNGLTTSVEILGNSPVFRIFDGYRTSVEIPLKTTVTHNGWHNLVIRMTDQRKRILVEVDGVGREAKARLPLPFLLAKNLKRVILGSDGKGKGFSGCIRHFFVKDREQDLHSQPTAQSKEASIFITNSVGRVSWGSEAQKPIWRRSGVVISAAAILALLSVLLVLYCGTRLYFQWRNGKGPAWKETRDIDAIPVRHFGPKSISSSVESHIYDVADRVPRRPQNDPPPFERAPTLPASRIRTVADVPLSIQRLPYKDTPYYRNEAFLRVTPPPPSDLF